MTRMNHGWESAFRRDVLVGRLFALPATDGNQVATRAGEISRETDCTIDTALEQALDEFEHNE